MVSCRILVLPISSLLLSLSLSLSRTHTHTHTHTHFLAILILFLESHYDRVLRVDIADGDSVNPYENGEFNIIQKVELDIADKFYNSIMLQYLKGDYFFHFEYDWYSARLLESLTDVVVRKPKESITSLMLFEPDTWQKNCVVFGENEAEMKQWKAVQVAHAKNLGFVDGTANARVRDNDDIICEEVLIRFNLGKGKTLSLDPFTPGAISGASGPIHMTMAPLSCAKARVATSNACIHWKLSIAGAPVMDASKRDTAKPCNIDDLLAKCTISK